MNACTTRSRFAGLIAVLTLLVLVAPAGTSQAAMIGPVIEPTVTISVDGFEDWSNYASVVIDRLEFDPDPFVLNNITITNTTDSLQTYTVFIGLPTVFPAPNLISGQVSTTVTDLGGGGATLTSAAPGFPIYEALIDFVTVATLQDDPFSLTAPGGESNTAMAAFGPSFSLVPVTSSIGIQLRFSLTGGDRASIESRFDVVDVVSVPEPPFLGLAGMALLAMIAIGYRGYRRSR